MPEGPELLFAAKYVTRVCAELDFCRIERAKFSKNPEISWDFKRDGTFKISAVSRGKELLLKLKSSNSESASKCMFVRLGFGMTGKFELVDATKDDAKNVPKHAVLMFWSSDESKKVLCFVDQRRFGNWKQVEDSDGSNFSSERGPCIIQEYTKFRSHVLMALEAVKYKKNNVFDKQLCDVLHDQKYFNGIGNYLRAEIMFRAKVSPFCSARSVLEPLLPLKNESADGESVDQETKCPVIGCEFCYQSETPMNNVPKEDFLSLCHTIPCEVVKLGGSVYSEFEEEHERFRQWLQCYMNKDMQQGLDKAKRTVWYSLEQLGKNEEIKSKPQKRTKSEIGTKESTSTIPIPEFSASKVRKEAKTSGHQPKKRNVSLKKVEEGQLKKCESAPVGSSLTGLRRSKRHSTEI